MEQNQMVGLRLLMIKQALEAEMRGWRLTAKAPRGFKIIADEFGIKAKRGPEGKRAAYEAFCEKTGQTPKPADPLPVRALAHAVTRCLDEGAPLIVEQK